MGEKRALHLNNGCGGEEEPVPESVSLLPLCLAAVWLCALTALCLGLKYSAPLQSELETVIRPIWRTPLPTPTLNWPTPSPTNTPRPMPTPTVTPTTPLYLQTDEIDTVAALVAYEGRGESLRGRTAIAYVLLHRCEQERKLPSEVLTKEFFGSEEGAGHLANMKEWWKPDDNPITLDVWQQITLIAIDAVNGWGSPDEFPTSTHFYSRCILEEPPTWTTDLTLLGCVDCHCFYGGE